MQIYLLTRLQQQSQSWCVHQMSKFLCFSITSLQQWLFLWEDDMQVVFAPSLSMESNALEKSMKNNITLRFFTCTPLMIQQIIRFSEFVKRFLIFSKNFFDFKLDTIEKQGNINLHRYSSKSYIWVILRSPSLEKKKILPFIYFSVVFCS